MFLRLDSYTSMGRYTFFTLHNDDGEQIHASAVVDAVPRSSTVNGKYLLVEAPPDEAVVSVYEAGIDLCLVSFNPFR